MRRFSNQSKIMIAYHITANTVAMAGRRPVSTATTLAADTVSTAGIT